MWKFIINCFQTGDNEVAVLKGVEGTIMIELG